ncbi:MAG: choice-of-anchor J domain-containing protein [Bacteroidales bacterium]
MRKTLQLKERLLFLLFLFVTMNIYAQDQTYCEAKAKDFGGGYEHIAKVEYGDVSNDSGESGYFDYTNLSTKVAPGTNLDLKIVVGTWSSDAVVAFIDWNQDKVFSNNERYGLVQQSTNYGQDFTLSVQVPFDAVSGKTRMRIIVSGNDSGDLTTEDVNACDNPIYGEVEDYSLEISAEQKVKSEFKTDKVLASLKEQIVFTSLAEGNPTSYEWNFGEGANPATATGVGPHTVVYNTVGKKNVSLKVVNASSEETETKEEYIEVVRGSSKFDKPHHIYAKTDGNDVSLHWFAPGVDAEMSNPEGFESGVFPPAGWDIMKSSSLTELPVSNTEEGTSWELRTGYPYMKEGKYTAMINLDQKGCNWLVTPNINVTSGQKLNFDLYFANGLDKSKFDVMVFADEKWTNILAYNDKTPNNTFKEKVEVDLASFVNKKVRIAFVHTYTGGFNIAIDQVAIVGGNSDKFRKEAAKVLSYNVFRDDVLIHTTDKSKCEYKDSKLLPGKYTYKVNAVYADGESFFTRDLEVSTQAVGLELISDKKNVGIGEDVQFSIKINGTAEDIEFDFGENATPAKAQGVGPHIVSYSSLGKKTIKLKANNEEYRINKEFIVVRPGVVSSAIPENIAAKVDYNDVTLNWRPNDTKYKLKEGFEGDVFPPANWSLRHSSTPTSYPKTLPFGMSSWIKNNESSFLGEGYKYIHWGNQSAAIPFNVVNCQWLITPQLSIEDGDQLKFYLNYHSGEVNGAFFYTKFHVLVKVGSDWTKILYYGEGQEDNIFSDDINLDLSQFKGEDVFIAFVYESSHGFELALDDVAVVNPDKLNGDFKALNIYRDDEIVKTISDPKTLAYTDSGLETTDSKYYITMVNKKNEESFPSNEVFVRSNKIYDLPYSQDFESSYSEILLSSKERSWTIGDQLHHNNSAYSFPERDGNYAAINCAASGKKIVSDYMILSPVNLKSYWNAFIEFDYVNEIYELNLEGRKSVNDPWVVIKKIEPSTSWKHEKISLPQEMREKGYQFAFFVSNASFQNNGAAIDNISVGYTPGKNIRLSSNNKLYADGSEVMIATAPKDATIPFQFLLENIDSETVQISSVEIEGECFELKTNISNKALSKNEGIPVDINFVPTEEKEYTATLTVKNNSSTPNYSLTLKAVCGKSKWTYMLYLYEDGTGLDGNDDINQWEVNGSIPGKVNYIVMYDSENDDRDGIYYIEKDPEGMNTKMISRRISTEFNKDLDMNDSKTLENFMLWVKKHYPAHKYGLNVWDHGNGIFRGEKPAPVKAACGEMTMWDMASAVKKFKDIDGQGVDIIGFDVCLAGQVETAYEFKDLTKVVCFSEKTEPGSGWEYNTQFAPLNENPDIDIYKLSEHFVNAFVDSYCPNGSQTYDKKGEEVTYSAVRMDKFKLDYIPALNKFSQALIKNLKANKAEIKKMRDQAWYSDGSLYSEHRDLGHFLKLIRSNTKLPQELRSSAQVLLDKYKLAIVKSRQNLCEEATGMKIWMTEDITASPNFALYLVPQSYLKISETDWDDYLKLYKNPIDESKPQPLIFTSTKKDLLVGQTKFFIDGSSVNPITQNREWSFSPNTVSFVNGTDKNSVSPIVEFTAPGTYSVVLKITNAKGEGTATVKDVAIVSAPSYTAPTNLQWFWPAAFEKGMRITWEKPKACDGELIGYKVYLSLYESSAFNEFKTIMEPDATEHEFTYEEFLSIGVPHGYVKITALYKDPDGESEGSNVVFVDIEGLEELDNNKMSIYPNPCNGRFILSIDNGKDAEWLLFDVKGQLIKQGYISSENTEIDINRKGMYFVKVKSQTCIKVFKVISR